MLIRNNQKIENQTYREDFSNFLANKTRELVKQLMAHINNDKLEVAIEVYDVVIAAFLMLKMPFANLLTILKGDLLHEGRRYVEAATAYKEVIFNFYRFSTNTKEARYQLLEPKHLTGALIKIASLSHQESKDIFLNFAKLLQTETIEEVSGAFESIIKIKNQKNKDYATYQQLYYLCSYLDYYLQQKQQKKSIIRTYLSDRQHSSDFGVFLQFLADEISIFKAIDQGEEKVRSLLEASINIDVLRDTGESPLQYAIKNHKRKIVDLLIQKGVHVEATNQLPLPLFMAIQEEQLEIVNILLEMGANPSRPCNMQIDSFQANSTLISPLFFAIKSRNDEIAKMLIDYGAELMPNERLLLDSEEIQKLQTLHPFLLQPYQQTEDPDRIIVNFTSQTTQSNFKAPIFCPHALDGAAKAYQHFAEKINAIDKDRPVYGIQAPLNEPFLSSIEDYAKRYIQAIKSIKSTGPYILFGWSFGGLLSYEIARTFIEQGEEVFIVGMFDTLAPVTMHSMSQSRYAEHLLEVVNSPLSRFWETIPYDKPSFEELCKLSKEEQIKRIFPSKIPSSVATGKSLEKIIALIKNNLLAALNYHPKPLKQEKKLFIPCFNTSDTCAKYKSPSLGWDTQLPDNIIYKVIPDTQHFAILEEGKPVESLANYICNHKLVMISDLKNQANIVYRLLRSSWKLEGKLIQETDTLDRLTIDERKKGNNISDFFKQKRPSHYSDPQEADDKDVRNLITLGGEFH
jgi:thioesterase domain-containing protein